MKCFCKLPILLPFGALLLFVASASSATVQGPVRVTTPGFSVIFSGRWNVQWNDSKTRITARAGDEELPTIIMESAFLPSSPKPEELKAFQAAQQKNRLDNVLTSDKLRDFIAHSTWQSERKTLTAADGASVEKMEIESATSAPQKQVVCVFLRNYHSPHSEVYFAQIEPGTCVVTQKFFEEVATRIQWKK